MIIFLFFRIVILSKGNVLSVPASSDIVLAAC